MNDDELRGLIRAAIQKHMGGASGSSESAFARQTVSVSDFAGENSDQLRRDRLVPVSISFGQYKLERASDDTSCLIEPAVQCNHCGFCKCHGH